MPIDPKRIARYATGLDNPERERWVGWWMEAVRELLAERSELLALLREIRNECVLERTWDPRLDDFLKVGDKP